MTGNHTLKIAILWYKIDMKSKVNIINIDGTEGVGKTIQCSLIFNKISKIRPSIINHLEDTEESCIETIEKTNDFLSSNENGVVINDGSIARLLANDIASGLQIKDVLERNQKVLHLYEVLCHKYESMNILMICDDIESILERVRVKNNMLGVRGKTVDLDHESKVVKIMKSLDIHSVSRNLSFSLVQVLIKDSIMTIEKKVNELLIKNFDI